MWLMSWVNLRLYMLKLHHIDLFESYLRRVFDEEICLRNIINKSQTNPCNGV